MCNLRCTKSHFELQDVLEDRDPRRNKPLIKWILSLPLEFQGDSAFESELIGLAPKFLLTSM